MFELLFLLFHASHLLLADLLLLARIPVDTVDLAHLLTGGVGVVHDVDEVLYFYMTAEHVLGLPEHVGQSRILLDHVVPA